MFRTKSTLDQQSRHPAGSSEGGRFAATLTTGVNPGDRAHFSNPYESAGAPVMSFNWREHRLPQDSQDWDNIPEFELAVSQEAEIAQELHGELACRKALKSHWERQHQLFVDAVNQGNRERAALHAEHIRIVNRTAAALASTRRP